MTPLAQPGNPKPRHVSHSRVRRADQPPRLQQRRARRLRRQRAAARVFAAAAASSASTSARTQRRRSNAPPTTISPASPASIRTPTTSPSTSRARTPRICASCSRTRLLDALLDALCARRDALAAEHRRRVPMFVKIAPDIEPAQIESIAATLAEHGVDGVVATNTTLARDGVAGCAMQTRAAGCRARRWRRRRIASSPRCAPRSAPAFRSSASAA